MKLIEIQIDRHAFYSLLLKLITPASERFTLYTLIQQSDGLFQILISSLDQ